MRSVPKGRCGPCFSRIPKGSTQVPCDFSRALTKSPAVSSSHLTGSDCAQASAAESNPKTATREINELSIGHWYRIRTGQVKNPCVKCRHSAVTAKSRRATINQSREYLILKLRALHWHTE